MRSNFSLASYEQSSVAWYLHARSLQLSGCQLIPFLLRAFAEQMIGHAHRERFRVQQPGKVEHITRFYCSFRAHRPARALLEPEFFASVQSLQIDLLCLEEQRRIKCLYRIEWAGPEAAADYAERPDTFKADWTKLSISKVKNSGHILRLHRRMLGENRGSRRLSMTAFNIAHEVAIKSSLSLQWLEYRNRTQ